MDILINLFIFSLVLFLYIHIYYHLKTSNYLEIYEIDSPSKEKFEELCYLKQPLIINNLNILSDLDNISLENFNKNYSSFHVKVVNNNDESNTYLPLKFNDSLNLFENDTSSNYISEFNSEFLEETTIEKILQTNDLFLRPYNIFNFEYDIIFGSLNSYTKLRYNLNTRTIIFVPQGEIEITLIPPKDYKYLHVKKNYENFEFVSSIDIYNLKDIYQEDFNKIKLLRVNLLHDKTISIPPYWFYSIKILKKNTLIFKSKYTTTIATLAILPELAMKFLQQNNIKSNITKIIT